MRDRFLIRVLSLSLSLSFSVTKRAEILCYTSSYATETPRFQSTSAFANRLRESCPSLASSHPPSGVHRAPRRVAAGWAPLDWRQVGWNLTRDQSTCCLVPWLGSLAGFGPPHLSLNSRSRHDIRALCNGKTRNLRPRHRSALMAA